MILGQSSKPRSRASIACAGCRARRTKCVIGSGQTACDRCRRLARPCVLRDDDERKRPVTKAQVQALVRRIATLEQCLGDAGVAVPQLAADEAAAVEPGRQPGQAPPTSNADHSDLPKQRRPSLPPPPSRYVGSTTNYHIFAPSPHHRDEDDNGDDTAPDADARALLARIPFAAHDHLLGQFWACYNAVLHVVHRGAFEWDGGCIAPDAATGGTRMVSAAGTSSATYYTPFLHVCMLAVGYRYADRSRPAVQALAAAVDGGAARLHAEARRLAAHELQAPGGLPSVQALLLLGDLECGVGRYSTGWQYAGMATRLVFDLGLNRQCGGQRPGRSPGRAGGSPVLPSPPSSSSSSSPPPHAHVQRTVLWACVVLDRFWGLFLGRPTSIKTADLSVPRGAGHPHPLLGALPMGAAMRRETQTYEALVRLTATAAKLTDHAAHRPSAYAAADPGAYYFVAGLHRELRRWHRRLPAALRWTPANVARGPGPSFFNLHQQYHALYILLYRPFLGAATMPATATEPSPPPGTHNTGGEDNDEEEEEDDDDDEGEEDDTDTDHGTLPHPALGVDAVVAMARQTCFAHAVAVARIHAAFAARSAGGGRIVVTGMQHAATAAFALVEGLRGGAAGRPGAPSTAETLQHLQRLAEVLYAHAGVYYPARVMTGSLFRVLAEFRDEQRKPVHAQTDATAPPFWTTTTPPDLLPPDPALSMPPLALQPDWPAAASTPDANVFDFALDSDIWASIMNTLAQPADDLAPAGWARLA